MFTPGARTLGDELFPQIGNGGYDARHYEIELDYDPVANRFDSATTTITAVATQNLSQFSLDFQDDLPISAVRVNGANASFSQRRAVRATRQSGDRDPADEAGRRPGGRDPRRVRVHRRDRLRKGGRYVLTHDA